jgi:hypothetical protein
LYYIEIRNKGVGYYKFSMDEIERQQQMRELQQLRQETLKEREQKHVQNEKRASMIEARLERLREKKLKYESTAKTKTTP